MSIIDPLVLLLVEDSPGDVRLTRETFRQVDKSIDLHGAVDGVEAMNFLNQEDDHLDAPRPDLILLDLNLPKMDGHEVLSRIKNDNNLKTIPTVILTTSGVEEDIVWSYELHANVYLRKPVKLDEFEELVRGICEFWLTQAQLPQSGRAL